MSFRSTPRVARAGALLVTAGLVFAACSSGTPSAPAGASAPAGGSPPAAGTEDLTGQTVNVTATWGGDEQTAFLAMVKPWEDKTGAKVAYTGTRDLSAVLTTGIASGVLPDLAGIPGPGVMVEYATAGHLQDLSGVLDLETYKSETAAPLVDLGTVDGKLVGVFIKTAVKGLIWYNPNVQDFSSSPPATWDDLKAALAANASKAASPWCVGFESGAASGWPGTDWIEDIVLRQSGPDVYKSWYEGKTKWSDPAIKSAFTTFGEAMSGAYGGADTVLTTAFANGGDALFDSPPGCLVHHQASFITGLGGFVDKAPGTDYNFFPFPDINPEFAGALEGAGDIFGMFKNTPASASLMRYLVTAEAQNIWVKIGGAISANKNASDYPDDISKRSAALVTGAKIFAFDGSDLMPNAMNTAFFAAILKYVQDPASLDSVLADLDTVQADAYAQ